MATEVENESEPSIWVHRSALEWLMSSERKLNGPQISVMMFLMASVNHEGLAIVDQKEIAKGTNRTPGQVSSAIRVLKEKGGIQELPEGGYRIPKSFASRSAEEPSNHLELLRS